MAVMCCVWYSVQNGSPKEKKKKVCCLYIQSCTNIWYHTKLRMRSLNDLFRYSLALWGDALAGRADALDRGRLARAGLILLDGALAIVRGRTLLGCLYALFSGAQPGLQGLELGVLRRERLLPVAGASARGAIEPTGAVGGGAHFWSTSFSTSSNLPLRLKMSSRAAEKFLAIWLCGGQQAADFSRQAAGLVWAGAEHTTAGAAWGPSRGLGLRMRSGCPWRRLCVV